MPEETQQELDPFSFKRSQHFSAFLSLAAELRDKHLDQADAKFQNFIRNVRDYDVGLQTMGTRFIGQGGTFTVRRTIDPSHRPVVFKSTIKGTRSQSDAEESERLKAVLLELRILLHPTIQKHRNFVHLFQVGWEGDAYDSFLKWPVLVMEYADRGCLTDFFHGNLESTRLEWRKLCLDVSEALLTLHKCGVFHSDLKFDNILVFSDEESGTVTAKLSDFGSAILAGDNPNHREREPRTWNSPNQTLDEERRGLTNVDLYALALVIWRIALNGDAEAQDEDFLFFLDLEKERVECLHADEQLQLEFLNKAMVSVAKYRTEEDVMLLSQIFETLLQGVEKESRLYKVTELLQQPEDTTSENNVDSDRESENGALLSDTPIPFSFTGSDFTPMTMSLEPKILESLANALSDERHDRKLEAATALAWRNIAGDDFGLLSNVDRGLSFFTLAALLGSEDHRILVYRMHKAFGKAVPKTAEAYIADWLKEGASRGSLVAAEDLKELQLIEELQHATRILCSRYCGIGNEIFEFDEVADQALLSSNQEKTHEYLVSEFEEARSRGKDWSDYLLMLASTYGNTFAIEVLIEQSRAHVDDTNEIGNTAILYAAWSGHADSLQRLLQFGADPSLANVYGETPLHWLGAFEVDSIASVGKALVDAGASLDAMASDFVLGYHFLEMEYTAGTPLHRAVAKGSSVATQVLLELGADPFKLGGADGNTTPFELAVLLHYSEIVEIFLSHTADTSRYLLNTDGSSILTRALPGGALYGTTFGRLIRHGHRLAQRAKETLKILLDIGASTHLQSMPGFPDCSAIYFSARCHPSMTKALLTNADASDIDRPATTQDAVFDEEGEDGRRPPIFEAILHGRIENIYTLLEHGANPCVRCNPQLETTILYECAQAGLQDMDLLTRFINANIGVDTGPEGHQTPFQCAILNRTFVIAEFFRDQGADVNALSQVYMTGKTRHPTTVLRILADENSPGSLACIEFLFRRKPSWPDISFIVEPATNSSILHILAGISGDQQNPSSTLAALDLCWTYFDPQPSDVNAQTFAIGSVNAEEESPSGERVINAIDRGGNTVLHLAVISANLQVVRFILVSYGECDTMIVNGMGLTALELAMIIFDDWEAAWRPTDIPRPRQVQKDVAGRRREEIVRLLRRYTPVAAREDVVRRFSLASAAE